MIFKFQILFFFLLSLINLGNLSLAEEKFEGLVVSVGSEAITTYDLSERIKLVLKSLNLEDNIKNRDSVRERVLELLIIEKLKKIEAEKSEINISREEIIQFASIVYNFPVDDFNDFKSFLKGENIDYEIVLEQLRNELLWKKLSQQIFSSKITINSADVDTTINNYKNKIGKTEFNFAEIIFHNKKPNDWEYSERRMNTVISLLDGGASFNLLANKFSDVLSPENNGNIEWVLENNLDEEDENTLINMKIGEIKSGIKISKGYKIIKLNGKRKFGGQRLKFSFFKFSSFEKEKVESLKKMIFKCDEKEEKIILDEGINYIKIENVYEKDLSSDFQNEIKTTNENNFTSTFKVDNEFNILFVCKKGQEEGKLISRDLVERRIFSKKFNQLSNTFISNIRKSANIKFFNK